MDRHLNGNYAEWAHGVPFEILMAETRAADSMMPVEAVAVDLVDSSVFNHNDNDSNGPHPDIDID